MFAAPIPNSYAPVRVAFVTLARATFSIDFARETHARSVAALRAIAGVELITPDDVLIEPEDAARVAAQLAGGRPDLLIIQNGTFALGNLALELAQRVPAPILLWAVTEPGMDGGALRSNSLVGLNLNASNLHKAGYRPRYIYGPVDSAEIMAELERSCRVAGAIRMLAEKRIGLIGSHATGFYNLAVDPLELHKRFGVEVQQVGLQDAFAAAHALPAERADAARSELETLYPQHAEVSADSMEKMARQFGGIRDMARERGWDALALRCWPEWAQQYGIAACGTVSALNSTGMVTGCEGDVDGAVTMLLGQALSGEPAYLADFIQVDTAGHDGIFWHNGCAAGQLAARANERALNSHFAGGKGVTAGFTFRPGRITVARITHCGADYRIFMTGGEATPTRQLVKGVIMQVRFDTPGKKLLDVIVNEGIEHHLCVFYGDHREALRAFAHWKRLPVVEA